MDNNEPGKWLKFFFKRVVELIFLTAWLLGTWALYEFVIKEFPLEGLPKLMTYAFEGVFAVSTLWEVVILVFGVEKREKYYPWWR